MKAREGSAQFPDIIPKKLWPARKAGVCKTVAELLEIRRRGKYRSQVSWGHVSGDQAQNNKTGRKRRVGDWPAKTNRVEKNDVNDFDVREIEHRGNLVEVIFAPRREADKHFMRAFSASA